MKTTSRLTLWTATFLIVIAMMDGQPTSAADVAPPPAAIPVAHSALLIINATPTPDGLALHVLHAGNQIPIDGRDVTVSVDGKSQPITAEPEGTFLLPTKDLGSSGDEQQLDITVAHDGIREILTGKIALPKVSSSSAVWRNKQMAWWVLNISIVAIAAFAFSRKTSKPEKESEEEEEEKDEKG